MIFAGNFAPESWRYCDGSLLSVNENMALFALIGTTYGGDGKNNFALPDLRGRIAVGTGTGNGLPPISLGESAGTEIITLNQANLPAHAHDLSARVGTCSDNHKSNDPTSVLAQTSQALYAPLSASTGTTLAGANVKIAVQGGNQPISIIQPYQAINYIICVEGMFPVRN
jgi:microcystin-dependent protein